MLTRQIRMPSASPPYLVIGKYRIHPLPIQPPPPPHKPNLKGFEHVKARYLEPKK